MNNILKATIILLLSIFSFSSLAAPQKAFSYKIRTFEGKTTLSKTNIIIPSNELWIFLAGSEVLMPADSKFTIRGKLRVDGTQNAPVTFKGKNGTWLGLQFIGEYEKPVNRRIVSNKIPVGLSFIRYAKFENIGSSNTKKATAFSLINYDGLIVSNCSISNGQNYMISSVLSSEIHIDATSFSGTFIYPLYNSLNSLIHTNNNSYPSKRLYGTIYHLSRSAGIINNEHLKSNDIIISSRDSSLMLKNSSLNSRIVAIFQYHGLILKKNTSVLSSNKKYIISQSNDSNIIDYDNDIFGLNIWPNIDQSPHDTIHRSLPRLQALMDKKIKKNGEFISLSQYKKVRRKILSSKKYWKKFSNSIEDVEAEEFTLYSDIYYLHNWLRENIISNIKISNALLLYVELQKALATNNLSVRLKEEQQKGFIADMVSLTHIRRGTDPFIGHCKMKGNEWYQDFTPYIHKLKNLSYSATKLKKSSICTDLLEGYFNNFDFYPTTILKVYKEIYPQYL